MVIRIKDIMKKSVITVSPDLNLSDVAKIMTNNRVGSVVVLDGERPVGIVTDSDIVTAVALGKDMKKLKVKDVKSDRFVTTKPGENMLSAARKMVKTGVKRLPVVEKGRLIGIVSDKEILIAAPEMIDVLSEKLKSRVSAVASPDMEISGICEGCEGYSDELRNINGRWLCEECRME